MDRLDREQTPFQHGHVARPGKTKAAFLMACTCACCGCRRCLAYRCAWLQQDLIAADDRAEDHLAQAEGVWIENYDTLRLEIRLTRFEDARGRFPGCAMEWRDVTEAIATQEEITSMVQWAAAGGLDGALLLHNKIGFERTVSSGLCRTAHARPCVASSSAKFVQPPISSRRLCRRFPAECGTARSVPTGLHASVRRIDDILTIIVEAPRTAEHSECSRGPREIQGGACLAAVMRQAEFAFPPAAAPAD